MAEPESSTFHNTSGPLPESFSKERSRESVFPWRNSPLPSKIKITRLLLKNFLTFEEDTVEFTPEFNIITGPNGAGKSSVYQALKFVLGSNNYDRRYSKWSDFIRTKEKYAVVQVDISVDGKIFRVQRSVEQEKTPSFVVQLPETNKWRPASVMQIKEFINWIRIDPDNIFSFMSQGHIDSIKDFKEEVLCSFVERGIGLSSIREQIANQKHMIQDLEKEYQAILNKQSNFNSQLHILAPKLQRLTKKQEYLHQLDDLNEELLWIRRNQIQIEINQKKASLLDLDHKIADLNLNKSKIIAKKQLLTQTLETIRTRLTENTIEQNTQKTKIEGIQREIDKYTAEKNQIADQIQQFEKEIDNFTTEDNQNIQQLDLTTKEKIQLDEKIGSLISQRDSLQNEERRILSEMQQYQHQLLALQRYKDEFDQISLHLNEILTKLNDFPKTIDEKLREIDKIHKDLQQFKWFWEHRDEDYEKKLHEMEQARRNTSEELLQRRTTLETNYHKIIQQLEKVRESCQNRDLPKPEAILHLMDEIKLRGLHVTGPLIDYISFDELYQSAIQSIFGKYALYGFIATDRESYYHLKELAYQVHAECTLYLEKPDPVIPIEKLAINEQEGIFGYLVQRISILDNRSEIVKLVHSIAGKTLVVKDHIIGTEYLQKYGWRDRIVTLDGEQLRSKSYVIETRLNIQGQKIGSVAQIKQQLVQYEQLATINRAEVQQIDENRQKIEKELTTIHQRIQKIAELLGIYKRMQISTQSKNNLISDQKNLTNEKILIAEKMLYLTSEIKKIETELPSDLLPRKDRLNTIPSEIQMLDMQMTELRQIQDKLSSQITKLTTDHAITERKILFAQENKVRLEQTLKEQEPQFFTLFQELKLTRQKIDALLEEYDRNNATFNDINKELILQDSILKEIDEQLVGFKVTFGSLQKEITEQQTRLDELDRKVKQHPERLGSPRLASVIEGDIATIETVLHTYRDVDDSLLIEKKTLEDSLNRIQAKLLDIQNELNACKNTEVSFEQQYYARFQESITILQDTINKMFQKAAIAAQAHLKLEGEFDTLRLLIQTTFSSVSSYPLSALSGGQRSMVGICLMLALDKLHPSPFSIYDEIEMFLDPENSQIVARLIHARTEEGVQFVILMPDERKTLIQLADRVIGITRNGQTGPSTVFYAHFLGGS